MRHERAGPVLALSAAMKTHPHLAFDEIAHRYTLATRLVPSVTQVIGNVAPRLYSCANWYLDRGRIIHKCIHLIAQGKLDWSSVDPQILGRLKAYERFLAETKFVIERSEVRLASTSLQYAGTLDALITRDKERILVDWKSSFEPQLEIQLGGYFRLAWENDLPVTVGLGIWLRDDGTYRCKWFTKSDLRRAQQTFFAALTMHNWMIRNGIVET